MYLERVDIVGFRGINRISLNLDDNTVLIGENAWGKSSLLDALTLLLSPNLSFIILPRRIFITQQVMKVLKSVTYKLFSPFAKKILAIGALLDIAN